MSQPLSGERDSFTSKFGVIAAAAGSAIGLGNIWRFPYVTGENGGGAFLFVYLLFVVAIGIPVMTSEFIIGRSAQKNPYGESQGRTLRRIGDSSQGINNAPQIVH